MFVGRERELAELSAGLEEAVAGRGRLFLLAGEPGIGKSRLADELASRARTSGAGVLWGRCWEAGGAPAYWPWVQAIRSHMREESPDALRSQIGRGASDMAQMVPEIADLFPGLPSPPSLDPDSARFRLFDSTSAFLGNAAATRPIVLVLDDLHAADVPSLLMLRFLCHDVHSSRLLILASYRDTELTRDHPLEATLAELARERSTRRLALRGLEPAEVARFIELTTGVVPPETLVEAVHAETEGNPLFVGEVIRLLAAEGRLDDAGGMASAPLAIPEGIREAIGRRLAHLSGDCRRALTLASVLGREFELQALGRVTEIAATDLLGLLGEASAARLVGEISGTLSRWRFSHALVRDALYDEVPPDRRVQLHRWIGEALESLYAGDPEPHLAELAHHFFTAAPGGDAAKAARYARRAGDRAAALLAYEEAVRLYEMALEAGQLAERPDDELRCELLLALGDGRMKAGDGPGSKEAFLKAAEIARAGEMPERLARAALGYGGRFVWQRAGSDRRLAPLLQEGLAALGDEASVLRVRLLSRFAGTLRDEPAPQRRDELSREAVEMARHLDDASTLAYALVGRYAAIWGPGNTPELLRIAEEVLRVAERSGEPERLIEGRLLRHTALSILGDARAARTELEEAGRLAEELRQVVQRWYVASYRSMLGLFDGRFDQAEQRIEEALLLGRRTHELDPQVSFRLQMYALRREQGRLEEAEPLIRRSVDDYPMYPLFRCVLSSLDAELGRETEARAGFESLAEARFAAIPRDNQWLFAMSFLPEVAAFLSDGTRAEVIYELLLPYAELNVVFAPELSTGVVSRYLGIAALAMGRRDDAVGHLEDAVAGNDRMGARPWAARSRHDLARALFARDGADDRERAEDLLGEAAGACEALGMPAVGGSVAALLGGDRASGAAVPDEMTRTAPPDRFRREGEYWSIVFEGTAFRLKDTKGLRYLAALLHSPGREVHAIDLVLAGEGNLASSNIAEEVGATPGDAGEVLDARARSAYRQRLAELQEELDEAERSGDAERASRARGEMEFLAGELSGGTALGGRARPTASPAERARQSVTKAIKLAIARIRTHSRPLGRHLERTIRTGAFCSYSPDPRIPVSWDI